MKKTLHLLIILITCNTAILKAQTFSNWITDAAHPGLKVRWATTRDANNYSFLVLQVQSNAGCKMNITASLCGKDGKEKNGWKYITLQKDKTSQYSYKILNSCTNGFWWWYKDYKSTAVKFDDN